jgi:hypothetical protein
MITFASNIVCNKNSHLFKFIHSEWSLSLSGTVVVVVLSAVLLTSIITEANSILAASTSLNGLVLLQIKHKGAIGVENTFTISDQVKTAIKSNIDNGSNAGIV